MKTKMMKWTWMRNVLTLLGVMVGLAPALLLAGNAAWSKTAASGDWGTGANWAGSAAPGATTGTNSPDIAVFSNASSTLVTIPDANRNIAGILFTNAACGTYTNGASDGNKLLLSSGGSIYVAANVASNQFINAPLELEGDGGMYLFTNASTKTLQFGGAINGVSTAGNTNTLFVATPTSATIAITNGIGDGVNGGRLALVKNGTAGTLTLALTNTFAGGITLNAGVITLTPPTNGVGGPVLGTGPLTINGGQLYTYYSLTITATNRQTWNNNFSINFPMVTFDMGYGAVTMTTNITLTLPGGGYSDPVIVRGNIGESGGSRSLTINAPNANPALFGPSGSNSYSGGTVVNSGGLRIGNAWALGTGPLTINGGVIQQVSGNALQGISGITVLSNFNLECTSGAINLGGAPVTLSGARQAQINNGNATINGNISGTGASFALAGTTYQGYLFLGGSNTFDGGITLKPGGGNTMKLTLNHPWALGTGPLTLNQGTGQALALDASGFATLGTTNTQYWNNNSFSFLGSTNLNMGTGPVIMGTNVTLTVGAKTLTLGGTISASNNWFSLTKSGAGELVLGGANTYTGGTTVTAGRLTVGANATLGAGNVTVGTNTAVLALLGSNAIARTATLTLLASGTNACVVALSNSVPNVIAKLVVGGNTYTYAQWGTYGSTNSGARFKIPASFAGPGMLYIPGRPTVIFFQ